LPQAAWLPQVPRSKSIACIYQQNFKRKRYRPRADRPVKTTWNEFIKSHWDSLAAIDFFTKEILTSHGLVKYMLLVAIDYKTRKVEIAVLNGELTVKRMRIKSGKYFLEPENENYKTI
jgi:hypothetical protein